MRLSYIDFGLFPEHGHSSVFHPIDVLAFQLPVEMPDHLCQCDTHLEVSQVDANAHSGPNRERLGGILDIIRESSIVKWVI